MQYNFMQKNGNKGIKKMNPHASIKIMFLSNLQQWNDSCFSLEIPCLPALLMSGCVGISVGSCQRSSPDPASRSTTESLVLFCFVLFCSGLTLDK